MIRAATETRPRVSSFYDRETGDPKTEVDFQVGSNNAWGAYFIAVISLAFTSSSSDILSVNKIAVHGELQVL